MADAVESTSAVEGLYCPACDYLLTGLTRNRCPECGTEFDPAKLRRSQSDGVRPVEPWGRVEQIGLLRASVECWLNVIASPRQFARSFPRAPRLSDAIQFSWGCRALGLALLLAAVLLTGQRDGEYYLVIVLAWLSYAVGTFLCELALAGLCAKGCVTPAGARLNGFKAWWAFTQFGAVFVPLVCAGMATGELLSLVRKLPGAHPIGAGVVEEMAYTLTTIGMSVVWWFVMGLMIHARTIGPGRWWVIVLGIPGAALAAALTCAAAAYAVSLFFR